MNVLSRITYAQNMMKPVHGGSHLQAAQRSTQMEVDLARALSEAAVLKEENASLQEDVHSMIDLKLQLAEARAEAA